MNSERTMTLLRVVYDEVHLALWAALIASLLYFAVFIAPRLPEHMAAAERARVAQIAALDRFFCAKWRMGPGTVLHEDCLLDLQQLRATIKQRMVDETNF
jgi:hypothetical protein